MTKLFTYKKIFSLGIFFVCVVFFVPQAHADVLVPGDISTCGELASAGTYTLTQNVGAGSGTTCFVITSEGVVITDANAGYYVEGNIVADAVNADTNGFSFEISGSFLTYYDITSLGNGTGVAGTVTYNGTSHTGDDSNIQANAIFNDSSYLDGYMYSADYLATFNGTAFLYGDTYDAIFNGNSLNDGGNVSGDATFNDSSHHGSGDIAGNATFNGNSYSTLGARISGTATFNENSSHSGTASYAEFYGSSYITGGTVTNDATFNDSSYNGSGGLVSGSATFNDNSYNNGNATVTGLATFNDSSDADGFMNGGATFTGSAYTDFSYGGTITGTITFSSVDPVVFEQVSYNWSYNATAWVFTNSEPVWNFRNSTVLDADIPSDSNVTFYNTSSSNRNLNYPVFYDSSFDSAGASVMGTFYDTSYNNYGGNSATFYDSSYNRGSISTAIFNDNSYNAMEGTISGTATFNDSSYTNGGTLSDVVFSTSTFTSFGLNNSTITGTITFSSVTPVEFNMDNSIWTDDTSDWIFSGGTPTWIFSNGGYLDGGSNPVLEGDVIFNSNTSFAQGGTSHITGDVTINSTYLSGSTAPTNGIVEINNQQWYLQVDGTVYGSDDVAITQFVLNGDSYNYATIPVDAIFNDTAHNYGPVSGDATFNDSSVNTFGTVSGNADVYSPVTRPLGGTVLGLITYHGYAGFYFNDKNTGDGDWNNPLNWWTNLAFTTPAGMIPTAGDEVYVHTDIDTNGGDPARVGSIIFQGGSKNHISISVDDATFNATSTNSLDGTITGTTTFMGNLTDNLGTVTGTLSRLFNLAVTTTRNFTTEGGRNNWIVIAQGVLVDISGAVYNVANNVFKALNNGSFSFGGNTAPTAQLVVTLPTASQTIIKWLPVVDWDDSTLCQYSYNNWATTSVATCASDGADIARPAAGSNTLALRSTDTNGSIVEKNITFTYDNESPVYTLCGSDLLDEATREYYYLASDLTANCTVSVDTELRGASSTDPTEHTLTGTITTAGNDITLRNISVVGTTTSTGSSNGSSAGAITVYNATTTALVANGTSHPSGNGGNGGTIIVATSTTGTITANGANGTANGGNGGTLTITNSIGDPITAAINANGGSSTSCGNGGNGGTATINTSTYGTPSLEGGEEETSGCPGSNKSSGSRGVTTTIGTGHSSQQPASGGGGNDSPSSSSSRTGTSLRGLVNTIKPLTFSPTPSFNPFGTAFKPQTAGNTVIPDPFKNFQPPGAIHLTTLPTNFLTNISKFVFAPLPDILTTLLKNTPQLGANISSLFTSTEQGIANLSVHPEPIVTSEEVPGLFIVKSGESTLTTYATYDKTVGGIAQLIKTSPNQSLTVSLIPQGGGEVSATYLGQPLMFTQSTTYATAYITTPASGGRYVFTTSGSPTALLIEVIEPVVIEAPKQESFFTKLWKWFH